MEVSGQFHDPAALPPGKEPPRADLDAVVRRKIPRPHRESNPDHPIVQAVASR